MSSVVYTEYHTSHAKMSVKTSKPIHSHIGDGQICVFMPRNRPLTATRTSTPSALVVYWSYQSVLCISNDCNLEFWTRLALFIFSKGEGLTCSVAVRRSDWRLAVGFGALLYWPLPREVLLCWRTRTNHLPNTRYGMWSPHQPRLRFDVPKTEKRRHGETCKRMIHHCRHY
jgi:hypothetical protein